MPKRSIQEQRYKSPAGKSASFPSMKTSHYYGVDHHVGNTPLIRLRRLSERTRCDILGKAEFMNPGGSVKDRAALGIILDAEATGLLKPGDTLLA